MFLKLTEYNERIYWTKHSKKKMRQYRLSENRLKRILRLPERKEIGVAPGTIAIMQAAGTKKHPTEIWLMYQIVKIKNQKTLKQNPEGSRQSGTYGAGKLATRQAKVKIISAWRYPGRSPVHQPPPIPDDVFQELLREGIIK